MARIIPHYNPHHAQNEDDANRSERLLDQLMIEISGKSVSPHEELEYVRKILEVAMPETVAKVKTDEELDDICFVLPLNGSSVH